MNGDQQLCTGCGRGLACDDHHIIGEVYNDATTPACVAGCHQFLTRRQLDNGVDLTHDTPKSEADTARARSLGLHDLISLAVRRRQPAMIPVAELFDSCTGIASALLDLTDDPERPGRWLPDTIGARHRPPPRCSTVLLPDGVGFHVIEQLVGAVASQGEALLMEDRELAALQRLAVDAESLYEKFERLLGDDGAVQAAWAELPVQMHAFARRFQEFLIAIFDALSTDSVEDLPRLMEMAKGLAPVFGAMETFFADAETASTPEECRAVLLRLPEALQTAR